MTDKEAMAMALDALESCTPLDTSSSHVIYPWYDEKLVDKAIAALKERLAQPADPTGQAPCVRHCEAMAFQIVIKNLRGEIERLKAPQRTWVELTEDEAFACQKRDYFETYRAIDAKLKQKNGYAEEKNT
jgi:hypothetical protein